MLRLGSIACLALVLGLGAPVAAADQVVAVTGPTRVVVDYHGTPVAFALAHVEADADPEGATACQDRLQALVVGKKASLIYREEFGTDDAGTGMVHLKVGHDHVNQILVAEGLATYVDQGDTSTYARLLDMAQDRAKADQAGLWSRPPVVASTTPEPATPAAPAAPAAQAETPPGPFCAEISGSHFFASDDPRVDQLDRNRLIFYRSEAAARRAGKRAAPAPSTRGSGSEDDADRLLAEAKELYSQAIAAGNTTRRDDLYGEAFARFTAALQIYSPLVEASPDDTALAEKLRETMQLRYGAMKQRRF